MRKTAGIILSICLIISALFSIKYLFKAGSFYKQTDSRIYAFAEEMTAEGAQKLQEHFANLKDKLNQSLVKFNNVDSSEILALLQPDIEKSENVSAFGYAEIENGKIAAARILTKNKTVEFTELDINNDEYNWLNKGIEQNDFVSTAYFEKKMNAVCIAAAVAKTAANGKRLVLFALVSNADINLIIQNLDFGSRGYGFLTDYSGSVILHPRASFQFRNFMDIIKDKYTSENFRKVERVFADKKAGLIDEKDFSSFSRKIITFQPVAEIQCFIGAILNKVELGFPFKEAKIILMNLALFIALTVFFGCMLLVFLKFNGDSMHRIFRICSAVSAVTFIVIIGYVWYLQKFYGLPAPEADKGYVSDKASLIKFLEDETKNNEINKTAEFSYIPVGILIQSIKIMGVNEAQVSGIVWQKIKPEYAGKIKEGVSFPEAAVIRTEEIYRTTDQNSNLVIGWSFTATLRQQFDNRLYPFEQLDLKVQMRQKNVLDRAQFIPDLKSYDEYSSISTSFVSKDLSIPDWIVKQTYFTIQKNEYMTTFGHFSSDIKSNVRDLTLNITLQRSFLSNFFSTFLPFIVLLLLAFIGLLFSSNIEEKTKVFSFRASNMQGIASGFLLFLVFSIVNIRRQAISNNLLYIEYLYFFTFLVLLTLVLSVVHIHAQKQTVLGYKDGLFVKMLYWPVILCAILLITYFNFYC